MLTYYPPQIEEEKIENGKDPLFDKAVDLILETGMASTTFIQRKLSVGYARSAKILDEIEIAGLIGPSNGAKPRQILITGTAGQWKLSNPPPKPKVTEDDEPPIKWNKTKYADNKSELLEIKLGIDDKDKPVNFNLEKYGNILVAGCQFTSIVDLMNNVLVESMAKYSPEELRVVAIDGLRGDLITPYKGNNYIASHLLTPLIVEPEKAISAFKWTVCEIERRCKSLYEIGAKDINEYNDKTEGIKMPKILLLVNWLNWILMFSPSESEDNLYRIMAQGKKCGIYVILGTDYLNLRIYKQLISSIPAKLVFRPTDKKLAKDTGIPESFELTSPDEAILSSIFEENKKVKIENLDHKKIYEEIFE